MVELFAFHRFFHVLSEGSDSMLWGSHRVLSMSLAFAATGQLLPVLAVYHGSTFPDQAEGMPFPSELFSPNDEKLTHFWFFYFLPAAVLLAYNNFVLLPGPFVLEDVYSFVCSPSQELVLQCLASFGIWFLVGALLHIAEDSLVGRVPGLFFFGKIGRRVFRIASSREYLFVWLVSWAAISARYLFLSGSFFLGF